MSKSELIVAYVSGRIGRRDFVRRLTALGVSATAAGAYAQTLAPGASAAGLGRTRTGLRVLGQEDYPGGDFGTIVEILQTLLRITRAIASIIEQLLARLNLNATTLNGTSLRASLQTDPIILNGQPLSENDAADFLTLTTQLSAHQDALATVLGDVGGNDDERSTSAPSYDTPDDAVSDLQVVLEVLNGTYASVLPQLTDRQAQATLVSIALVSSRHAAFVNRLLDSTPFPDTFQRAATPDETDQLLTELQG